MPVILHALCYGHPISEECDSVEEAVRLAYSWACDSPTAVGYAAPTHISDGEGRELMGEDTLYRAIHEHERQVIGI